MSCCESAGLDDFQTQFDNSLFEAKPKLLPETMLLHVLSALNGEPKQLTIDELQELRRSSPTAVEKYVNVMNNPRLLEDLSTGRLNKKAFEDFENSLMFLETGKCSVTATRTLLPCLVIRRPFNFSNSPIRLARLSTFVLPWIRTDNLVLSVHLLDNTNHRFQDDIFELENLTEVLDSFPVNWFTGREVVWDVTAAMSKIQQRQGNPSYSIVLTLQCIDGDCRLDSTPWGLFSSPEFGEAILSPDSQAVLELYTSSAMTLFKKYGRKRLIGRSTNAEYIRRNGNNCPSFLDRDHREVKCCLFQYTLNKQQLDQNDKLRFIVFPHHLPLNICHGRCIGLYMPTDNSHSVLLNRYFSGLRDEEKLAIYDSMPCCAANETSPFTIVYKNQENKLVHETLQRAIKMNCACN